MLTSISHAQNFSTVVENLSKELQNVETGKEEISQSVSEIEPGVLQVKITNTSIKNGKVTEESYNFNLSDIDINTVKAYANKEIIQVQLLVNRNQKLIKKTTDNQKIGYTDAINVFADNIDNGRILADLFKSLIPLSAEITEKRLSLTTFDQHIDWLKENVKNVALQDRNYEQQVNSNPDYPGRLELTINQSTGKKSNNSVYNFNLANIDPNSLLLEIKGDVSLVSFKTRRKLNTVKYALNGEQKSYTNNIEIYCENVENARDLQKVLKEASRLSEKIIENTIPKVNSISQGLSLINEKIKKIIVGENSYDQNFSGECILEFKKQIGNASKSSEEAFFFNLKDLDPNLTKYDISSKNVHIELKTKAGKKYLKHLVDDVQKNYHNELILEVGEVEDAIIIEDIFRQIIQLCENQEAQYSNSRDALLQQFIENIHNVVVDKTAFNQTFEILPDNIFRFKIMEIGEKKSKEKIWEFNAKDINPASINFETASKKVFVSINTNYMEKIIKYYEDGIIGNYQNNFEIQALDIENARQLEQLLRRILQ